MTEGAMEGLAHPRLGILELGKRGHGAVTDDAAGVVELARGAEQLGYERFWLAEHHVPDATITVPEVLIGAMLASTTRIRVGPGGVILPYRSPYRVTELARSLAAVGGARLDLGLCRGPGVVDSSVADELVNGNQWELMDGAFEQKLLKTLRFLRNEGYPKVWPVAHSACAVWLLGSSVRTATVARRHDVSLAVSLFICQDERVVERAIAAYRAGARPGDRDEVAVAVSVMAAATHAAAVRHNEELVAGGAFPSNLVGDYDRCRAELAALAERLGVTELLLVSLSRDVAERAELHAAMAVPYGFNEPRTGPKPSG